MANVEVNRRFFLKLGVGATSVAGAISLVDNEFQTFGRGIETADGIFVPLYEFHSRHVTPDKMPRGTNIYFTEITSIHGKELFETAPLEVVDKALLDKKYVLSQNSTELMVGDVAFNEPALTAFLGK